MILVALIEDNRLVREGLADRLNETEDVRVAAAPPQEAEAVLQRVSPRVILLDAGLGERECLRLTEEFRTDFPEAKLVIMDLSSAHDDIVQFVNAGVSGFIAKDATFDDLLHTIRTVADGKHVLPPDMTTALFSQIANDGTRKGRRLVLADVRLTPREVEVVELIGLGKSNREIATALSISENTVKSHVRNLMEKLALRTRLQVSAYSNGAREANAPRARARASG